MCWPVLSHQTLDAEVISGGRSIRANTSAQAVASSIMGLISATSGCPHTAFLKPLAWFHLPFASEEETVFRAVSAWLLKQYFRECDGELGDWTLDGLKETTRPCTWSTFTWRNACGRPARAMPR